MRISFVSAFRFWCIRWGFQILGMLGGVKMSCFFCCLNLDPCLLLQSNATMHVILVFQTKHGSFYTAHFWRICLPKDLDRYLMELLVDGRKPPELHKVERTHNSTGLQCIWLLIWGVERRDIIWTFTSRTMITWVICCVLTDLSSSTPQTHFFQWQLQCTRRSFAFLDIKVTLPTIMKYQALTCFDILQSHCPNS